MSEICMGNFFALMWKWLPSYKSRPHLGQLWHIWLSSGKGHGPHTSRWF